MAVCLLLAEAADASLMPPSSETLGPRRRFMIEVDPSIGQMTEGEPMTTETETRHENYLKLVRYSAEQAHVASTKREAASRERPPACCPQTVH